VAYQKLFDAQRPTPRTVDQCRADLAAWTKATIEWGEAFNKNVKAVADSQARHDSDAVQTAIARRLPDDPETKLSVEELTRDVAEAEMCWGRVQPADRLLLSRAELRFTHELLSRAESVISAAHRNEEYLLEPGYRIGDK
jgi:hypothetical protein